MSEEKDKLSVPKVDPADAVHSLSKVVISAVPVIGGPALELFQACVAPSLELRRIDWMNEVATRIKELEENVDGFSIEGLQDNPQFISVMMHASTIAIRNHQEEKLEALRNAVINTALEIDIEENLQLTFLNYIDSLTPLHMRILMFFHDPEKWINEKNIKFNLSLGSQAHVLEIALPELKGQRDTYDQTYEDLYNRGLVSVDKNRIHVSMSTMLISRSTEIGRKFIQYITQ